MLDLEDPRSCVDVCVNTQFMCSSLLCLFEQLPQLLQMQHMALHII